MGTLNLQPGDILLYRHFQQNVLAEVAIDIGEVLEDGPQPYEYYHVAIALGDAKKIESNTAKVEILPVDEAPYDAFRPPLSQNQIAVGLGALRNLVNQPYDWWLVADDTLRYLTDNVVHFGERFIQGMETKEKICSTLVSYYFLRAGFGLPKEWPKPSPEDIWLMVKDYPVFD
jgi:hypothetical protein